jgi:hypothetical protein
VSLSKTDIDALIEFVEGLTDDELHTIKEASSAENLRRQYTKVYGSGSSAWRKDLGGTLTGTVAPKISHSCSHEWKESIGLFKTYEDCTKCGIKKEDVA